MALPRLLKRVSTAAWRATAQHLASRVDGARETRPWRQELVLEIMRRDMGRVACWPPEKVRQREMATPLRRFLRRRIALKYRTLGERPCLEIVPRGWTSGDPTLLYLHGGGYCVCSSRTHRAMAAQLAIEGGVRCLLPDYRLAPEDPFPAAIDDAVAACGELAAASNGVPWYLGGDSAGGGLSLATMVTLRDRSLALPAAAVLLSPWVDLTLSGDSIDSLADSDYLNRTILSRFAEHYLASTPADHPLASPVEADLRGLPPMHVQVGGGEVFSSEVNRLGERLAEAGVPHRVQVFPGACHVFQAFAPLHPDAVRGLRDLGDFLRQQTADRNSAQTAIPSAI